jgi:hypothetical protein
MATMRDEFASWYPISEEDRRAAYTDGLVVLDTNVLLDLYRFDKSPREEVLNLLQKVLDRLWLPHQVALEFHRNRLSVIHDASQQHGRLRKEVEGAKNKLQNAFNTMRSRIGMRQSPDELKKIFDLLDSQVNALTPEEPLSLKQAARNDPILDQITALYSGRVGEGFNPERHEEETKIGQSRVEAEIPPGYVDRTDKADPLGDYFLWRQTLDEAKKRKQPILLVTQENKPDWLHFEEDHILIGPRRELVAEMLDEANVRLHLVSLRTFLQEAAQYLETPVSEQTVEQASRLQNLRDERSSEGYRLEHEVAEALMEKGWHLIREIAVPDANGRLLSYDFAVPFQTGPEPDAEAEYVMFDAKYLRSDLPRNLLVRAMQRRLKGAMRVAGPVVLVVREPVAAGGFRVGAYHCEWGEFPKLQVITVEDLQSGHFDLPVAGIEAWANHQLADSQEEAQQSTNDRPTPEDHSPEF